MTITQTIEIPTNRRKLMIDIPREIPAGRTIIAFTPAPAKPVKKVMTDEEELAHINKHHKRLNKRAEENLKYQFLDIENWEDDE